MERRTVRTVLITGCSLGGLGSALAIVFHAHGSYRVIATARSLAKMSHLHCLGMELLQLDVNSEESIESCVQKVSLLTGGYLDLLVNNAGGGYNMPIIDANIDELRKQFELNVLAPVSLIQAFFPLLRNSECPVKLVVNNTSSVAVLAVPFLGPYGASKAALAHLSNTLRLELRVFGIKVVDLRTGGMESKFFEDINATTTGPTLTLPGTSPYVLGKDVVEKFIATGPPVRLTGADAWATTVVKQLSRRGGKGAPNRIWCGQGAVPAKYGTKVFPSSLLDAVARSFTGLAVVEGRIRNEGKGKTEVGMAIVPVENGHNHATGMEHMPGTSMATEQESDREAIMEVGSEQEMTTEMAQRQEMADEQDPGHAH